jgi:hypothetical protein
MISGNCRTCANWDPTSEREGACNAASHVDNPWMKPELSEDNPFGVTNGSLYTLHSFGCESWKKFENQHDMEQCKLRRLPVIERT